MDLLVKDLEKPVFWVFIVNFGNIKGGTEIFLNILGKEKTVHNIRTDIVGSVSIFVKKLLMHLLVI